MEELAISLGGSSEAGQKMKAVEGWNPDCYFASVDYVNYWKEPMTSMESLLVTETISASLYRLALVLCGGVPLQIHNPTFATSNLIPMNWVQIRLTPTAVIPSVAFRTQSKSVKSTRQFDPLGKVYLTKSGLMVFGFCPVGSTCNVDFTFFEMIYE